MMSRHRREGEGKQRPRSAFAGSAGANAGPVPRRRRKLYEEEDYVDDYEEEVGLAYDDPEEEEEEEEESEIEWKRKNHRKTATSKTNAATANGVRKIGGRDLPTSSPRGGGINNRQGSSPTKGVNRRSRSAGGGYVDQDDYEYEDPEDEEEEDEDVVTNDDDGHRRRERMSRIADQQSARQREAQHAHVQDREWNNRSSSGLPQPPPMASGIDRPIRGGPRTKSVLTKFNDDGFDDQQQQNQSHTGFGGNGGGGGANNLHMRFSAMNMNGSGNGNNHGSRSESRMSVQSVSTGGGGAWPNDLPRLPRTPGSGTTPGSVISASDGGGYFDIKPQPHPQPHPISDSSGSGSANFGARQIQAQAQGPNQSQSRQSHYQGRGSSGNNNNLNLDDPPPHPTIVRTPSPGPSGYTFTRRELPQPQPRPQSQSQGGGRPQSEIYNVNEANRANELERRRTMYTVPPSASSMQHEGSGDVRQQRPQSQVYNVSSPTVPNARVMQQSYSQGTPQHHQSQQPQQQHRHQLGQHPTRLLNQQFNKTRYQPQTPAPPPTVGIESPHPIGGREKLADIPKLEEDSNDGSDVEGRNGMPRIRVDPSADMPGSAPAQRPPSIPMINIDPSPVSSPRMVNSNVPMINIEMDSGPPQSAQQQQHRRQEANQGPKIQVYEVPGVSVSGPEFDDGPSINVSGPDDHDHDHGHGGHHPPGHGQQVQQQQQHQRQRPRPGGLMCGGCQGPIIGRIVSAMGCRWHPACFKCTVCGELLEHVSSYEHDGMPYCHLDYHENFAPRCYSCKTAIIEEQFISLDDPALGKRTYHTQHFFCAECGDPFLSPSGSLPTDPKGELALSGDGEFEGFTVYKGHPYCEACHVRLRLPKCKRCKRSIRDHDEAVEALGGKWCWSCFVCASCHKPFEDPSFFQRGDQPYCEQCFSIMLRNEI
ncbi:hypothetical protein CPB84DRAFT_148300 [Gymnopilus junonius]|uniref:LIM zinc-binding domain-containing protein n=1 Tax=Gymnopilus junonius TaxID=109634 RepID=A0A9P5TK72_GYMJU|nr:hypothetical protein CPB84DRAFT_148300 [Gymnopilus junonius]